MSSRGSESTDRPDAATQRTGEESASRLFALVYKQLHSVAVKQFRRQPADHSLQPTALLHEAYLRMADHSRSKWNDRAHFLAIAAKAMRQILINHAHRRAAQRRGGGRRALTLIDPLDSAFDDPLDVLMLDEALTQLSSLSERMGQVVELRVFGGMTVKEVAHTLGVSARTVEGDWELARAWLSRHLRKES